MLTWLVFLAAGPHMRWPFTLPGVGGLEPERRNENGARRIDMRDEHEPRRDQKGVRAYLNLRLMEWREAEADRRIQGRLRTAGRRCPELTRSAWKGGTVPPSSSG